MDLKVAALIAAVVLGLVLFLVLGERQPAASGLPEPNSPPTARVASDARPNIIVMGAQQPFSVNLKRPAGLEPEAREVIPRVLTEGAACAGLLTSKAAAGLPSLGARERVFIEGGATATISNLPLRDTQLVDSGTPRVEVQGSAAARVLGLGDGTGAPPTSAAPAITGVLIEGAATCATYKLAGAPFP
jgi:hypothetical protein